MTFLTAVVLRYGLQEDKIEVTQGASRRQRLLQWILQCARITIDGNRVEYDSGIITKISAAICALIGLPPLINQGLVNLAFHTHIRSTRK